MSLSIRFRPEAQDELVDGADCYEQRRPGLGVKFVARVREALQRISIHPQMHAKVYGDVRRAVVADFPYVLICCEEGGVSVFHTSRDPADWQSRI
jgi:toxin ParE1/3/4